MVLLRNVSKIILIVATLILIFPHYAYAYIDPGTGSYVIQIIIAAFVAVAFTAKVYWLKIKGFVSKLFFKKKN